MTKCLACKNQSECIQILGQKFMSVWVKLFKNRAKYIIIRGLGGAQREGNYTSVRSSKLLQNASGTVLGK